MYNPNTIDNRNKRPDNFNYGIVRCFVRHRIGTAIKTDNDPKQQAKDKNGNRGNNRQQYAVVDPFGILAIVAELFLKIDFFGLGHANTILIVRAHWRVARERTIHRFGSGCC
jgi:hypothetical protein